MEKKKILQRVDTFYGRTVDMLSLINAINDADFRWEDCSISTEEDYDGYPELVVYHERLETDEEYEQRVATEKARVRGKLEQERELFLALKKKYEGEQ